MFAGVGTCFGIINKEIHSNRNKNKEHVVEMEFEVKMSDPFYVCSTPSSCTNPRTLRGKEERELKLKMCFSEANSELSTGESKFLAENIKLKSCDELARLFTAGKLTECETTCTATLWNSNTIREAPELCVAYD